MDWVLQVRCIFLGSNSCLFHETVTYHHAKQSFVTYCTTVHHQNRLFVYSLKAIKYFCCTSNGLISKLIYRLKTCWDQGKELILTHKTKRSGENSILNCVSGSLMLIAWMTTGTLGMMVARYLKKMATGTTMCNKDLWFVVSHRKKKIKYYMSDMLDF